MANFTPASDGDKTFHSVTSGGVEHPGSVLLLNNGGTPAPVSAGLPVPVTVGNAVNVNIESVSNPLPVDGGIATDTPYTNGDSGLPIVGVRLDSDSSPVSTDGDYHPFVFNATGRLKVSAMPAAVAATTGTITANGQNVQCDVQRASNVMMYVTGTFSTINLTFEGSIDGGVTWFGIQACRTNANTIETTTGNLSAAPAYAWEMSVNAMTHVRARATAYTSGTMTIRWLPGAYATEPIPAIQTHAVTQSGTWTVNTQAAHDAAVSGNPYRIAGRARATNYTTVADNDTADFICTTNGVQIVRPFSQPELDWTYAAAASGIVNTTTAVTVKAAAGAGVRNYVTGIQVATATLGGATELAIRDGAGGAVLWRTQLQTTALPLLNINFNNPLRGTANTLLEIVTLTAVTGGVYVNLQGYAAP